MEGLSAKWKGLDEKQQKTYGGAGAVVALVVLYIVFFWTPSCASSKSCAELKALYGGWDLHNPGQRGDVTVCGESDNGFGPGGTTQCYGGTNSVRFPAPRRPSQTPKRFGAKWQMANANGGALHRTARRPPSRTTAAPAGSTQTTPAARRAPACAPSPSFSTKSPAARAASTMPR